MRSDSSRSGSSKGQQGPSRPARLRRPKAFAGRLSPARLEPMYATVGTEIPHADDWTFEPKYDGMRVLAFTRPVDEAEDAGNGTRESARPRRRSQGVRLMTRNGRDKSGQFPEVVEALRSLARRARRPVILDGEIVVLERDRPGRFQTLQSRMHLQNVEQVAVQAREAPAALIAFDILQDGDTELFHEPWTERRRRLEQLLRGARKKLRLSETTADGGAMVSRANAAGWEGVIAKRTTSLYNPGSRSRDWLKLKLQYRAEFVVGGYTEPRKTRQFIGALLLGYYDKDGQLVYVGHMGGGFTRDGLADMYERMRPLERATPPFHNPPKTNEPAHWVEPKVVVEVKFAEWTADRLLRQPIFLGVRDDKDARDVGLEGTSLQEWAAAIRRGGRATR